MYLPRPLALASGCLKSLLFAAMSSDNLPSAITLASVDVGIRGAHLATYVGLSRAGLQLPVGLFLPPPAPITDTELALYVTPVAAAVWSPSVDAIDALVKTWTTAASTILPVDRAVFRRTIDKMTWSYGHSNKTLARQPVLSPITLQDDDVYIPRYNQSHHIRSHSHSSSLSPILPGTVPPLHQLMRPVPAPLVQLPRSRQPLPPSVSPSDRPRPPVSAAIRLGQCSPYRVLPVRGDAVLETDLEDDSAPAMLDYGSILDDIILDELEEPKRMTNMFVMYRPPPCTEESCALVVYTKPSTATYDYDLDCWVLFWYCHVWTVGFFVAYVCCMMYRIVRWIARVSFSVLMCTFNLPKIMLEILVQILLDICAWFDSPSPTPSLEFPSLGGSLPVSVSSTPTANLDPHPSSPSITLPDATAHTIRFESASKKKKKRRDRKKKKTAEMREGLALDPASLPLPDDDPEKVLEKESNLAEAPSTVVPSTMVSPGALDRPSVIHPPSALHSLDDETTAPLPPSLPVNAPTHTSAVDLKTTTCSENAIDLAVSANVNPSLAPARPGSPPIEEDEGGWETVVRRKPRRTFMAAAEALLMTGPKEATRMKVGRRKGRGGKNV